MSNRAHFLRRFLPFPAILDFGWTSSLVSPAAVLPPLVYELSQKAGLLRSIVLSSWSAVPGLRL